ncbi:transglutaminase domain-containing protein, partial [Bacteroides ovatus]
EFYTVATKYTDAEGKASLTAGKGDMLVWASRNGQFGYAKISFGKDDALQLSLNRKEGEVYSLPMDLVPPVEGANIPEVTPEQRVENDRRMVQEDSIRNAYVATMMTEKQAKEWIDKLYGNTLQPEKKEKLVNFLVASRGNHQTLKDFLSAIRKEKDAVSWEEIRAIWILESLSAKDLRDVTLDVLNDHLLTNISDWEKIEADLFKRMYLNPPRIANEMLTPYKKVLREAIEKTVYQSVPDSMKRDPKVLIEWCRKEIKINNELNSQQIPISPMGVWKARVADEKSRDIFFVAAYRSMGWASAAWIDEVTGKVQILNEEFAKEDVNFDTAEAAQSRKGVLQATYTPIRSVEDPKYYSHFTLSKFKNGTFQLLNYDEGETDMGDGTTWRNLLKYGRELDEGYYMMVTGTRLASGAVLSNSTFFTIEPGKTTTVDLVMRESKDQVQVIGNFNSEATYRPVDSTEQWSILQTCGRGYFIVAVLGVGQEPTNHALRDIAALGNDFEQWGRKMVFLFPSEEQYKKFNADEFKGLPSTITYGIDVDDSIRKEIVQAMNLNNSILPVFIIADTFNRVVFVSQGYTIGLGEQLMKVVHGL